MSKKAKCSNTKNPLPERASKIKLQKVTRAGQISNRIWVDFNLFSSF
jgi:hypothetical protein